MDAIVLPVLVQQDNPDKKREWTPLSLETVPYLEIVNYDLQLLIKICFYILENSFCVVLGFWLALSRGGWDEKR